MRLPILIALAFLLGTRFGAAQPEVTSWNVLHEGLGEKNPDKRRQAVTAIGSIGLETEAIKLIEQSLHADSDYVVRQTAAATLGQMRSKQSVGALKAALDDDYPEVAFAAAKSLWDMGDHTGEDLITEVLTGEKKGSSGFTTSAKRDANQTLHSPKAMATLGFKEASGALLGPFNLGIVAGEQALRDGSASGRTMAATMLSQACGTNEFQTLSDMLSKEKNWAVRAAVARALGQCGNKDAVPKLEMQLSDSHEAVRYMAAGAIVRLNRHPIPPPDIPRGID
jgi:HEAT repeat protein